MKILLKMASSNVSNNFSSRFRRKRFKLFLSYLKEKKLTNPKILDVGGTEEYWNQMNLICGTNYQPVINNLSVEELSGCKFSAIVDDGKSLSSIKDKVFDIAYSNSVIEHLSTFEEQQKMADNIQRIGQYYFVQTPAFIFPFEPHFHFPFFHWLPQKIRIWLVMNLKLGWYNKCQNYSEAEQLINSIRIMRKRELELVFKNVKIITERFCFIPKSYMIINVC